MTGTLRGVSNKHCLLSSFSLELPSALSAKNYHVNQLCDITQEVRFLMV